MKFVRFNSMRPGYVVVSMFLLGACSPTPLPPLAPAEVWLHTPGGSWQAARVSKIFQSGDFIAGVRNPRTTRKEALMSRVKYEDGSEIRVGHRVIYNNQVGTIVVAIDDGSGRQGFP
jgi:hypothetical protein